MTCSRPNGFLFFSGQKKEKRQEEFEKGVRREPDQDGADQRESKSDDPFRHGDFQILPLAWSPVASLVPNAFRFAVVVARQAHLEDPTTNP